jgi:hypothetical protein
MLCRWVRRLARKGWSAGDIASIYQVSKADVLSMLAPVAVKPPNLKRPGACFTKHNAWSDAARTDPRYRDPVSTLEAPAAAAIAAELDDQAAAAELAPGPAADPPPPIAESWGSVHASGPRKITADVLAEALQLREAQWSWPAIARKFGCHRMAFYHALRRPPR